MDINQLPVMSMAFTALLVLYWHLLFTLIDKLLENPQLKKKYSLPLNVLNMAIIIALAEMVRSHILPYVVIFIIIVVEFSLFYKDKFMTKLFCALACIIHVLTIVGIISSSLSLITGFSAYKISNNSFWLLTTAIISLTILNMAILGVIKFIPLGQVKAMSQYKERQWFIIAWMAVNNVYLLYNLSIFNQPNYHLDLALNQLISSFTILAGLYIVLFLAIKTSALLEYKEKNVELEQAVYQEQQYRNSIIKDAITSYEVNLTRNIIVKGFNSTPSELECSAHSYSEMLVSMAKSIVHPDDLGAFGKYATLDNILHDYESGRSESVVEYRRLVLGDENGEYIWVRAITNFMKEQETGDILGFTYIKNVDAEKRNRLELQHKAERDSLTGLYNKAITGELINKYLDFSQSHTHSALFMIDIDNFKEINDHLGHVYGDAVLGELADKLKLIFRSDDIIGRIGGDEYIAFFKDGAHAQNAEKKAEEICKAFHITYKGQNGEEYTISASVGISLFPKDGKHFEELYTHADSALYRAKNKGKNTYIFHDGSDFSGYKSNRTKIHTIGNVSQKGFRENRVEYIFKILYHSENPVVAIYSALELVASHFSFERGYIFETSSDGKTTSNTFEWCAESITPEINSLQNVPLEIVATANASFEKTGIFILKSLNTLTPMERAILEPQGIKSMFQFGIFNKGKLLGFIGFDNCRSEAVPSDTDIDEMETICNILATFFVKHHADENTFTNNSLLLNEIMNNLDIYTYVINMKTFELLFLNGKAENVVQSKGTLKLCHEVFRSNHSQCPDCPVMSLTGENSEKFVSEVYNDNIKKWVETTVTPIAWSGCADACLINCVDITKYKSENVSHIKQLEHIAYCDELTGARSYSKFKKDAERILENDKTNLHYLVKVDIDNFKLINQIYGYEQGNETLRRMAKAIEKTTRSEDEIFARVANDEFIALFTIRDEADISDVCDTFQKNFDELIGNDITFKYNFPQGRYVIYPSDNRKIDMMDMFEKVNLAHKAAKLNKSTKYSVYNESMTQSALYEKEIEDKMEKALAANNFHAFLQPKYQLKDGLIGGAEALARWIEDDAVLFSPGEFIPIFEANGFITKLDMYMLGKVCAIIKGWIEAGITPVVVSVNFSRLHLHNSNLITELCNIVDSYGIERKFIEIEITETTIFDNIDVLEAVLHELHGAGFTMSIDDFGSGYSSLGMLEGLQIDVIKLDRSFFTKQKNPTRSKAVISSIIQMASCLGIKVVAEGIEKKEHIDLLHELHCDMVQGFYYARPMPDTYFTNLISAQ